MGIETGYCLVLMLFFLCRHFCAPVYNVSSVVCYFCTFPKCCARKTETVRLEHSKQPSPNAFLSKKVEKAKNLNKQRKKTRNMSWYQLWSFWLHYYCTTHSFTVWDVSPFVSVWHRLFVCLCVYSVFSVSLCQSTNTETCFCAT